MSGSGELEKSMPIYALDDWRPELPPKGDYWIAPDATLIGRVRLLKGASVWFGSVLRGDNDWITVGERCNIQDLCILHTDPGIPVLLGTNVTIGHGVVLHGATVGDNTVIGMGATLLNHARIGKNCIVGAHALIPEGKEFPDNSLIVGVPGRAVRSIPEAETAMLTMNAQIYFDRWQRYRHELKRVDSEI
jgi:carbonic anhydrase/acetyltransferase-like protein (isoleucine patch superfamily)